jgi:hypothetical protein
MVGAAPSATSRETLLESQTRRHVADEGLTEEHKRQRLERMRALGYVQ